MDTADRVARIDHADLLTTLSEYRPAHVADEKAKAEKEARAIKKMIEIGILRRDATEETYTIDRVIEVALPYDALLALHDVLYNAPDLNTESDDDDDEGDQ
jgi:CRISPR/Cas system-associated endonuclease Cas3-HD